MHMKLIYLQSKIKKYRTQLPSASKYIVIAWQWDHLIGCSWLGTVDQWTLGCFLPFTLLYWISLNKYLYIWLVQHNFTMQSFIREQSSPRPFIKGQDNIWLTDFIVLCRPDASLGSPYWPLGKPDVLLVIGTECVIAQSRRQNGRVFQDGTHPPSTTRACPGTRTSSLIFMKHEENYLFHNENRLALPCGP